MEDMTQPVTTPGSVELASKLEELSGLASRIVRCSDKLRAVSQGDFPGDSAAVFALLPVALSSAQNCLSVLEFIIGQTSISPLPSSHFISPAVGPLVHSPISAPIPIKLDRSVSPAEFRREECATIKSRVENPVFDPFWSTTPATQRWPPHLPPIRTFFEPAIYPTLGGRSDNKRSPSSPLLPYTTQTRRGVSIAELVDEEDSSPGTRGGMNASRSPGTSGNMSWASYPPLSIHFHDATPQDRPETPAVSQIESLRSSSPATPEVPEGRMTRSSAKRKAAENSETRTELSKRAKTGSP